MTMLDDLENYLRQKHPKQEGQLWSPARPKNWAKLHQTPKIWGLPMTEQGVMAQTKNSVDNLANAMQRVIASAKSVVDITSLDPPRGSSGSDSVFYNAIINGIKDNQGSEGRPLLVRMLFGKPPKSGRDVVHDEFKKNLARDLKNYPKITVLYGVFYGTSTGPIFNHSKIFASDTGHAVVGGHNLYDSDYRQYPPVHDVSVEVLGPAAIDARNFASYLWSFGIANQTSWNPLSMARNSTATWIVAWHLKAGTWTPAEESALDREEARYQEPNVLVDSTPPSDSWKQCRILTVGRAGGWGYQFPNSLNASDYMKEFLIKNAETSIKIAHQDLVAMDMYGMTHIHHATCKDLGNALYYNPNLKVYVVVTAPYGSGVMDVYYNVDNGPQSAADYIMYYSRPTAGTSKIRGVDDIERVKLWNRLFVAPIHFTNDIPSPADSHYYWPNADRVIDAGGALAKKGMPKSVGQHMKTMLIDDSLMVVGSDNHYPHPLAEINYVMEGDFVNEFKSQFWDNLWRYSGPHAVQQWNSATTISGA